MEFTTSIDETNYKGRQKDRPVYLYKFYKSDARIVKLILEGAGFYPTDGHD